MNKKPPLPKPKYVTGSALADNTKSDRSSFSPRLIQRNTYFRTLSLKTNERASFLDEPTIDPTLNKLSPKISDIQKAISKNGQNSILKKRRRSLESLISICKIQTNVCLI